MPPKKVTRCLLRPPISHVTWEHHQLWCRAPGPGQALGRRPPRACATCSHRRAGGLWPEAWRMSRCRQREAEEQSPFWAARRAKLRGGRSPRVPSLGGGPGAGGGIAPGGRDRDIHSLAGHSEKARSSFLLLMHKSMMRNCRLQSSLHGLWVTEGPEAQDRPQASRLRRRGLWIQDPF